jgi:hypothetical protein
MASPKLEAFALFHLTTGNPLTGQAGAMSFLTYKDDLGANVFPLPTITEIGGGWYGFSPTFPVSPLRAVVYTVDTGANGNPAKVGRYMRPEDYNADGIPDLQTMLTQLRDFTEGKWQIVTSGADANRLVVYAADGVTVLKKFDLLDANNLPTAVNPFKRSPVP